MSDGDERLVVYTARVSYSGPDRLDVTAKSADPDGKAFAPSWDLVRWGLKMREQAKLRRARGDRGADAFGDWAWKVYSMRYTARMNDSLALQRQDWDRLLCRKRVVLVCYCTDHNQCHRTLLAAMLVQLGARYGGEIEKNQDDENHEQLELTAPRST